MTEFAVVTLCVIVLCYFDNAGPQVVFLLQLSWSEVPEFDYQVQSTLLTIHFSVGEYFPKDLHSLLPEALLHLAGSCVIVPGLEDDAGALKDFPDVLQGNSFDWNDLSILCAQ